MIAVDVGNTRVKFGLFRDGLESSSATLPVCVGSLSIPLDGEMIPWDQIVRLFSQDIAADNPAAVNDLPLIGRIGLSPRMTAPIIIAASVNPRGLARIQAEWPEKRWPKPRVLESNAELPIVNLTRFPDKVGIDRLLKVVAANVIRPAGQPMVIVDSGTATTVDWITEKGEFAGGAILPGLELSAKALHANTAQLPLIESVAITKQALPAIGRDTHAAMESGLFWGQVGAVRELIQRMAAEQSQSPPLVLVTGGAGESLAKYIDQAEYRPTLTLEGVAIVSKVVGTLRVP